MLFKCQNCQTVMPPGVKECPKPKCQSVLKCAELGIPYRPEDYTLPLKLGPT